jgi:hypothetical protein
VRDEFERKLGFREFKCLLRPSQAPMPCACNGLDMQDETNIDEEGCSRSRGMIKNSIRV